VNAAAATSGRPSPSQAITVATVDGDPLARRALREQLATENDIELVGEASDASAGVDLVKRQRPDLVLIAISGRDRSGCAAIGEMLRASPGTRIIVLALEPDENAQMRLVRAGAAGWLLKSIDLEVLPRVLRGVRAGEAAVPRALGKRIVEVAMTGGIADGTRLRPVRSSLTRREWEVIDLLTAGATTAGIAAELQVTPATVRTHVKHILGKLGVHSRDEAVRHVERLRRRRMNALRQSPVQ
jgi:two-component system, NarL family, response regulator LiaR